MAISFVNDSLLPVSSIECVYSYTSGYTAGLDEYDSNSIAQTDRQWIQMRIMRLPLTVANTFVGVDSVGNGIVETRKGMKKNGWQ